MKVKLTFKMPDAVEQALEDIAEDDREEVRQACEKWVRYGEYITVEVDTEAGTCTVIPAG
jgi:hypothetical protein